MHALLNQIRRCEICKSHLPHRPNPVLAASARSRIAIIGQAPGSVVHASGVPWEDKSGDRLRDWLGVDRATFYNPDQFALVPMGFCYPGKGKSEDLAPRTECAPQWHSQLFPKMEPLQLVILMGAYAQGYYLKNRCKKTLTNTVQSFKTYLPEYFVLPHPSPRNNIWLRKIVGLNSKPCLHSNMVIQTLS